MARATVVIARSELLAEGYLAAREMEVGRFRNALRRAEELPEDVAAAIEGAAAG